jgi:tetratricopeptide (TPR) repeat protein
MAGFGSTVYAQQATITETDEQIRTYPFGDPSPIPILAGEPEIYPYFRFDGFSHEAEEQTWTVVTLENEYIKLFVLPEVGGKVYGAIEKSTGHEFIYQNEVLKFRDIAMRGPWTSGGIEFNFGSIGHAPSTATPVNYERRENPDGSVSCIVGAPDLPSRTRWQVEIRLPADRAYFETRTKWFNESPLNQSNYHWLTSAQVARDDLEFFFPGTHYIGHGGDLHSWPTREDGRQLSFYRNNNFGGSKSYHVLGRYNDFYGGYWHDRNFGYGHWGPYEDYPGQKLWIWALSRQGGIWEDLLTDTSGQYIESQSGFFYNQANLESGLESPFTQQYLLPRHVRTGRSLWFPVKTVGGMVEASPHGVLNVESREDGLYVGLNALQELRERLSVWVGDSLVHAASVELSPMEVYETTIDRPAVLEEGVVEVEVGDGKLFYSSDPTERLERPLQRDLTYDDSTAEGLFRIAEEHARYRDYEEALSSYRTVLEREPHHLRAAVRAAEILYRQGRYEKGLEYAKQALEISTYHPAANYYYGLLQQTLGSVVDARDGFAWAVRDPEFRIPANIALARLSLQEGKLAEAARYARGAVRSTPENVSALELQVLAERARGNVDQARAVLDSLQSVDPLSHFARFERYLLDPTPERLADFRNRITYELPHEIYLELAVQYAALGREEDAIRLLQAAPDQPIVRYWQAYLLRDRAPAESKKLLLRAGALSPGLVYPYRTETMRVLEWADERSSGWTTSYYLGLVHWSKQQKNETWKIWQSLGDTPDFASFYLTRGLLAKDLEVGDPAADFERALAMNPDQWRAWHHRIEYALEEGNPAEMVERVRRAYEQFPDNYVIGMDYARLLLAVSEYAACLEVLEEIRVLPYEGAGEGHNLWVSANVHRGLELLESGDHEAAREYFERAGTWPEHLGVGRPYHPDTRMVDYLRAEALRRVGDQAAAEDIYREIVEYTDTRAGGPDAVDYFAVRAYQRLGQSDEAHRLFARLRDARGGDAPMIRWMEARLNGEPQRAAEIMEALRSSASDDAAPWKQQSGNRAFKMVVEIAKALKN